MKSIAYRIATVIYSMLAKLYNSWIYDPIKTNFLICSSTLLSVWFFSLRCIFGWMFAHAIPYAFIARARSFARFLLLTVNQMTIKEKRLRSKIRGDKKRYRRAQNSHWVMVIIRNGETTYYNMQSKNPVWMCINRCAKRLAIEIRIG